MADKPEHKMSRKELKAPDEFQKLGQQAMPFMVTHQKTIFFAIVGAVAIGGVVAVVNHFNTKEQEAARNDFAATLKVLQRPVNPNPKAVAEGETAPEPVPFWPGETSTRSRSIPAQ